MTLPEKESIFRPVPDRTTGELLETLIERSGIRIERIVSTGQATPEGVWYDQPDDEWVLLLSGSACLLIQGEPEPLLLQQGDYLLLPARCRHRVEWTDEKKQTVWLACHLKTQVDRLAQHSLFSLMTQGSV